MMVRKKWKDMGAEEKEVWNGLVKREKKQEKQSGKGTFDSGSTSPNKDREKEVRRDMTREGKKQKRSVAREETGLIGDGKKQEAQVQGSSTPSKGMKLDTSIKVKRATKIRKRSPASSSTLSPPINSPKAKSNDLPICNKDNTDPARATNSSDDDESGLRHLMTHLVPKLMEGGVVNLEVAQAMVTKKWGEMGVEEKASWIQMARSRIIMEKAAEQPEVTFVFNLHHSLSFVFSLFKFCQCMFASSLCRCLTIKRALHAVRSRLFPLTRWTQRQL